MKEEGGGQGLLIQDMSSLKLKSGHLAHLHSATQIYFWIAFQTLLSTLFPSHLVSVCLAVMVQMSQLRKGKLLCLVSSIQTRFFTLLIKQNGVFYQRPILKLAFVVV